MIVFIASNHPPNIYIGLLISVGSLGKCPGEKDVIALIDSDSTISNTLNGIRIKSWGNSPSASSVPNITFENITFKNVKNPIIMDQEYCPGGACANGVPSKVQISDVTFKNIQGTSASEVGVTLLCSKGLPCKNVKLQDINITPSKGAAPLTSTCSNIKAFYMGTQVPPPCP